MTDNNLTKYQIKYFFFAQLFVILVNIVHLTTSIIYQEDIKAPLVSAFFSFGLVYSGLLYLTFRQLRLFINSKESDFKYLEAMVNGLTIKTTAYFVLSSMLYILMRMIFIFKTQNIGLEIQKELILIFCNKYILFATFCTYLNISAFTVGLKYDLKEQFKINFAPKNQKLTLKIILASLILVISPLIDLYYYLDYNQNLDSFKSAIFNRDVVVIFVLLLSSIILAIVLFIINTNRSLSEMIKAFKYIKRGDFSFQAAVLTNDEIGRLVADVNSMTGDLAEREFIKDTFGKYIDPQIASEVMKKKSNLDGEFEVVTIMFTDIADFTTISEKLSPQELVKMLNEYFSLIVKIIQDHKGVVNKFMGDAVMAVFNAPVKDKNHADNALLAAIEIANITSQITFKGMKLKTRIGINSDKVLIGNIGAQNRLEYTVIGDGVNVASRFEQLNKEFNSSIIIGQNTKELLKKEYKLTYKSEVFIKGKNQAQSIYIVNI